MQDKLRTYIDRLTPYARRTGNFLRRSSLSKIFLLWLVPFLIWMSFLFSEYLKNYNFLEVFPGWLIVPTLMHAVGALLIALILFFVRRKAAFTGKLAAALLLSLLLTNYEERLLLVAGWFRTVAPILPEPDTDLPLISLLFLGLLVALSLWVGSLVVRLQKKYPAQLTSTNLIVGIMVLPVFVFVGQAAKVAKLVPATADQYAVEAPRFEKPSGQAGDKPDIYYIVLDRYTNQEVLANQLGYDNTPFTSFLQSNGFTVNPGAYANYPFTSLSLASTLNASYTNHLTKQFEDKGLQSRILYHKLTQDAAAIKALKDAGYAYHSIGSTYGATDKAPLSDAEHMYSYKLTVFGKEKRLRGLEASSFTQTIFNQLGKVNLSWWPFELEYVEDLPYTVKQLATLQQLAKDEQQGGRFIFAHILNPHGPYFFNADGSYNPDLKEDNIGKTNAQKYLDQITFINGQMSQLVQTIHERSGGNAVIILNSDEGPYPTSMHYSILGESTEDAFETGILKGDMTKWPEHYLKMKYGILQAAHIPAATPEDMAQLTSINVFRIVLNRYLGYELPYLPQCYFGLPEGNIKQFTQASVYRQLTGQPTPEHCKDILAGK